MSRLVDLSGDVLSTIDLSYYPPAQTQSFHVFPTSRLMRRRWMIYKRSQDIAFAVLLAALLGLGMLAIGAWIRRDSPGPALFSQPRRGRHNVPFLCYKFRTMYHHAADLDARAQSVRGDPRITRIGKRLRKTSMDELPQLINVILGHMSLVGPRPHAVGTNISGQLLPDLTTDYLLRYSVKPGITGWAQVNGWRGILDTEDKLRHRLEHDLYYITHWSPWLDIKILLRTFSCVFRDHHAF